MADATMDAVIREPHEAETHREVAFEPVWRVLAERPSTQPSPDTERPHA